MHTQQNARAVGAAPGAIDTAAWERSQNPTTTPSLGNSPYQLPVSAIPLGASVRGAVTGARVIYAPPGPAGERARRIIALHALARAWAKGRPKEPGAIAPLPGGRRQ